MTDPRTEAKRKVRRSRVDPGMSAQAAQQELKDVTTNMLASELEPMSESKLQASVNTFLKTANPLCIWYPVPNATGNLGKRRGGILKAGGVRKAGVPDWAFVWNRGAGFIELKVGDNKQDEDQIEFEKSCLQFMVPYKIARSIEDVQRILKSWGVL